MLACGRNNRIQLDTLRLFLSEISNGKLALFVQAVINTNFIINFLFPLSSRWGLIKIISVFEKFLNFIYNVLINHNYSKLTN